MLAGLKRRIRAFLDPPAPGPEAFRPAATYLGDRLLLLRTRRGYKLYARSDDVAITPHLVLDGEWEPWVARFLEDSLRPGMRVVEVGANVGCHSLLIADRIGPDGLLVAFEAQPEMAALLQRNLEVNGFLYPAQRVRIVEAAAADREGERPMFLLARHHGGASLFPQPEQRIEEFGETVRETTVAATTVDATLARLDVERVDLIKIDAECSEGLVLAGAMATLKRNPRVVVVVELMPAHTRACGQDPAAVVEALLASGGRLHALLPERGLVPISRDALMAREHTELVRLPE